MDWLNVITEHLKSAPLAIMRFNESDSRAIWDSRWGPNRFSLARPHGCFEKLKKLTPCLMYFKDGLKEECFLGTVKSKLSVSTLESRASIQNAFAVRPACPEDLGRLLTKKRLKTFYRHEIEDGVVATLGFKTGVHVIETLGRDRANEHALRMIARVVRGLRHLPDVTRTQFAAIRMAIAAFGLGTRDDAISISIREGKDTSLSYMNGARLLEDNVIAEDARVIPGFKLIESDYTGHAVFAKGDEKLEVYTANRGPLEHMLGIDLIYINAVKNNIVMVQYKMLECREKAKGSEKGRSKTEWVFRPDKQFDKERRRMNRLKLDAQPTDYRLNREPFYIKFTKRIQEDGTLKGMILPLEHVEKVLAASTSKGRRGGIVLSYDRLGGRYLREGDFLGLIRAGYIGTHSGDTEYLKRLIELVSKGNRGLVLARQTKMTRDEALWAESVLSEEE